MKKQYSLHERDVSALYIWPYDQAHEEKTLDKDIKRYRQKSVYSGNMLECESYPIWNTSKRSAAVKAKVERQVTSKAQAAVNFRNTQKKMIRLLNANFSQKDMWITVGYRNKECPEDYKTATKHVKNYIRRLRNYMKKHDMGDLKYIFATECGENNKWHHHVVTNFKGRDVAEELWQKGEYPQARRLKPNDFGLEGLARYLSKEIKGQKSYGYSLNLIKTWEKPLAKVSDTKLSRRKADKIATGRIDPKEYYEKRYPGYRFLDMEVRYSNYCSGAYIYARLKKIEVEPKRKK